MQSHQICKKGRRTNLVREDESKEELDEEELQHPSDHTGSKSRRSTRHCDRPED